MQMRPVYLRCSDKFSDPGKARQILISRKSEISWYFTCIGYIKGLNLLRGSVRVYKPFKHEFITV